MSTSENPDATQHAIVLSGPNVDALSPEKRLDVARQLGAMLGANARVVDGFSLGEPTEDAAPPKELIEEGAFSLVLPAKISEGMFNSVVDIADQRAPGVMSSLTAVKRGLGILRQYGPAAMAKDAPVFAFPRVSKVQGDLTRATAVTFLRPQTLRNSPEEATGIRNLGISTLAALAEFAQANTTVQEYPNNISK